MTTHQVLVIGVGSIGERHLRCFQATGRARLAFVEVNETLRETITQRYGVPGFANLDAALSATAADTKPDDSRIAVVATPAHLHLQIANQLASADFHLLIEKPLSTSTDGVQQLNELCRQRERVVAVAYVYRCFPTLAAMRHAIVNGRFGKPLEIVAVSGQNFPTYRPAYRQTYYTQHETGGGAIQDALTHVLNAGEWLVGPVDRLVVDAEHQALDDVSVEDTVHLLARHGQVMGSYSLNQHQAPNEMTLTVVCQRGTVRWELHANRWRWMEKPDEAWHDEIHPPLARDDVFILQANRFLDAVAGRTTPACTLAEGLQTLHVNLAALASLRSGCWKQIGGD